MSASRSAAVLTVVRDEGVLLPLWLRYFSRFFAPADTHVVDHGGGVVAQGKHQTYRVTGPREEYGWLAETYTQFFSELQESYEYVLAVDVDEVVIADPVSYGDLRRYINRCPHQAVRLSGYDLFQSNGEPPIDFDRPLLSQRKYWAPSGAYSKPVLASVPLTWFRGQHHCTGADPIPDPELLLVHLQKMDDDLRRERYLHRYGPEVLAEAEAGWHTPDSPEEIPERFRGIL